VKQELIEILESPCCRKGLELVESVVGENGEIVSGNLKCFSCERKFPVTNGIPRFVPQSNYSNSFGMQWHAFKDIRSGGEKVYPLVRETILERSGWSESYLKNKLVLECGCGAGDDTETLLDLGAKLVSFDLSNSVDVVAERFKDHPNLFLIQADLTNIPVRQDYFDVVYCHRVIQHTPDPKISCFSILRHLKKKGGELFLHSYDFHWRSMIHWKYYFRPITKRLPEDLLLKIVKLSGKVLYPLAGLLNRFSVGRAVAYIFVPFYNFNFKYAGKLSEKDIYDLSLLVTFDALSPTYDNPNSYQTIKGWLEEKGITKVELRERNPVVLKAFT
jgi:ubiquinone/menaquinone biosynthesis C-methylase UbiE/uncharacterized protein YbaR (Trm112 family)